MPYENLVRLFRVSSLVCHYTRDMQTHKTSVAEAQKIVTDTVSRCLGYNPKRLLHGSHTPRTKDTEYPHQDAERKFLVPVREVQRFIVDCFMALGVRVDNAETQAKMMTSADYHGVNTHGLNNLDLYVEGIKKKYLDANATPKILSVSSATAWVDGNNTLGAVVGDFCMDLAMKKAQKTGASLIVAKNSNHYGICSWYVNRAIDKEMIAFSASNTPVFMAPPNGKEGVLGNNPLSFGAPGCNGDSFVVDLAMTASTFSTLRRMEIQNKPFPKNVAIDSNGKPVQTLKGHPPGSIYLLPFGGAVAYKAFGLSLMVETLSGVLAGGQFAPGIRWILDKYNEIEPLNLAHCFFVIDPSYFAPNCKAQMQVLLDYIRKMEPVNPKMKVLIPGDRKKQNKQKADRNNGIVYEASIMNRANQIAKELNVSRLKTK